MNSPWIKALLILSLGLNCMIAGAVAYRYIWAGYWGPPFAGPARGPGPLLSVLPPQNQAAHAALREKMMNSRQEIHAARTRLMELLGAQEPDRERISQQLDSINKMQSDMERMVVEQMVQDVLALPPEKREAYLADIQRSMFCRKGAIPGMGMGMGFGRDGRGRHRSKDFPPP